MQVATCGMFLSKEAWPQFGITLAVFLMSLFTFRGFDAEFEQIFKQQAFIELELLNRELAKKKKSLGSSDSSLSSLSESESSSMSELSLSSGSGSGKTRTDYLESRPLEAGEIIRLAQELEMGDTSNLASQKLPAPPSLKEMLSGYIHPSVSGIPPGDTKPVTARLDEFKPDRSASQTSLSYGSVSASESDASYSASVSGSVSASGSDESGESSSES
eukprot:TRINITY_DN71_c0_g1_i16.p1 TRINITY_DN71_c0_g1~~TRINITY_DN71_c0_g1_i16.p1  ORF type:complete len:217 (+),score=67.56 TRINITY_DN71_c0_g1_i16:193-843(+)